MDTEIIAIVVMSLGMLSFVFLMIFLWCRTRRIASEKTGENV